MDRVAQVVVLHPMTPPSDVAGYFRAYSGYVAAIAMRLLGRRDDVDDVVQDVFIAAIEGIIKLRDPAAVKGWLATVTARAVAARLRRRKFRTFLGLEKVPQHSELVAAATQEQTVLIRHLYQILDEMPVNQRIAWTLRHIEGEPLESVARICKCSLATVKRRIAAAQQHIQKAVRE